MRKNKGITLIALVITIIVLLILAGVALRMVAGNEGILTKAEKAVNETNIAGAKEQVELMIAELSADYYEKKFVDKTETGTLVNYIKNALATTKPTSNGEFSVSIDGSGKVSVTDKGGNPVVSGTLDENGKIIWDESAGGNGSGGSGSGGEVSVGETYYGDSTVTPIAQKYFTFTINEDGETATITGIIDDYAVKGYYDGYEVNRAINDGGTYITEVVVPYEYVDENNNKYTVTVLGTNVFGCEYDFFLNYRGDYAEMFTKIILPNTISKIEQGAFVGTKKLTEINVPNSVTTIGDSVFSYSGLVNIDIPASVTSIGSRAFLGCTSLSSINIPDSVTSIDALAFGRCTSLSSINIPDSVTSIGSEAFYDTAWYNSQPDGVVYAGKVLYEYKGTMPRNTTITVNEGTKGIAEGAFYGCTNLSSINIPNSVTSIGSNAFRDCTSLSSINIPDSVTSIGICAFLGWTEEQTINCEILEANKPSGWDAKWDYFDYSTPRKAKLNWGVSM